jgi:peptidoglycan/LPS O-acetylase OafA/YrhL
MSSHDRFHGLDAVRAFALLLGVVFHAGFSFIPGMIPGIWAAVDNSPSGAVSVLLFTSHMFRMSLFFLIAGFFARMLYHRKGSRGFWADRLRRILLPLVVGWIVLFPAIAAVWVWGITRSFDGKIPAPPPNMPPPPPGAFPLTHLWFLYYLLILYVVVVGCRAMVIALDRGGAVRRAVDAAVRAAVRSGAAAALMAAVVAAALYNHDAWIAWFGIPTPDRSIIPQATSLLAYGIAVGFGWLVNRQLELLSVWATQWPFHIAAALAATVACLSIGGAPTLTPAPPGATTAAYAACYALGAWCWTFGVIGAAMRFLSQPSAAIRYTADASYWIYLAHLPVVALFQVLVAGLPWHWSIKFPLIVVASLVVLLASYRFLVRSTFVGQALNGRRYPRVQAAAPVDNQIECTSSPLPKSVSTISSH